MNPFKPEAGPCRVTRRAALKAVAAAGVGASLPSWLSAQTASGAPVWKTTVPAYLQTLERLDGGYGWEDQDHSHLTPSFAVIGCYRALNLSLARKPELVEFVRTHHPSRVKKLEQERRVFEYQQVQALVWLGDEAAEFRDKVRAWTQPLAYLKQYEQHGYPIFQSELGAFTCRALLGLPLDDLSPHFTGYLEARRRENGSFNNTPASDGGDGHVMNTWWGLQALQLLGRHREKAEVLIAWLQACQRADGGFSYQPQPEFGGVTGVDYSWAAVRALKLLGAAPADRAACVAFLHSLSNADGGIADRPGWASNPIATYHAVDALAALDALDSPIAGAPRTAKRQSSLPAGLRVFSIQLEAHGQGSPTEAVDLARALRVHLWGAKNAEPKWLAQAQAIADSDKVPVKFFVSNEEYGTWVNVPGLGTYSHTSDIVAPAGSDFGPSLAKKGILSWPVFRERRLVPLEKGGGRLIWQFGENEELVRLYLDDSVERGGYAAISTFHFGNPDFTNSEPFLQRWRGEIPFVALQDAHGAEPWWFADMTTGFRTLFLATEPTWDAWLRALKENWTVAVRRDALSGMQTWMHSGSREVLDFVREREGEWRWWDNPAIQRPLVSLVAVKPEDQFEVARPDRGVALRVRCAWENTAQGLPKDPLTELVKLTVDGREQSPALVTRPRAKGAGLADHFHELRLPDVAAGHHAATVHIRVLATKEESSRTIEFEV